MKYIEQIRKYISVAAAAAVSACMLFGCTRADVASSSQSASSSNGTVSQGTVTGTASDTALAGAGAGAQQAPADGQTQAGASDSTSAAQQVAGQTTPAQNVNGTTTANASQPAASSAPQAVQNPVSDAGQAAAQVLPDDDEDDDPAFLDTTETFSGEYEKSDGEESVTISLVNDNQITFQFRESGIGGSAQASGSSAVYYGDDGYTITFDSTESTLAVSVGGEDAESSAMNGIYYRVVDGGDDAEEDEADEADDALDEDQYEAQDAGQEDADGQEDYTYDESGQEGQWQ